MPWSRCVDICSAGRVSTSGWRPDPPGRSVPSVRLASAKTKSSLSTAGGTVRPPIRGQSNSLEVVRNNHILTLSGRRYRRDLRARGRSRPPTTRSPGSGSEEDSRGEAFTCPSVLVLFLSASLHQTSTSARSGQERLVLDLTRR